MSDPPECLLWLEAQRQEAEDEARRIAKRDGVPSDWIEVVLAKLRGENAGRA
jgi:hypothetical protein